LRSDRETKVPAGDSTANGPLFPIDFLWGAATSSFQIEGSPLADGAGPSIWHRYAHTPGRIQDGSNADIACDHYRRFKDDVDLMASLGLGAYRFSIAWGRILPEGAGRVNTAGIDFYSRLIDTLLERGIVPFVTLFHWDLPAALEDRGGWLVPEIAEWFADYGRILFRAFGDRVPFWTTINEPWVVVDAGYLHGVHAPGRANPEEVPIAAHNLLRAHGACVEAFRAYCRQKIGLVVNLEPKYPASDSAADLAATERADSYMNRAFLDPVFTGRYPEGLAALFPNGWPRPSESESRSISQPLDFLGINYYTRSVVRHDETKPITRATAVRQEASAYTETGWEVYPPGLTRVLRWVRDHYGKIPLYVTENGAALPDPEHVAGDVLDDPVRIDYYRRHLLAAHQAIEDGVDLRGYFAWSLMDNFEWAEGFTKRFGVVHVDYETLRRTPKTSAGFYRDVIRSRGQALREPLPE
jgi:beta-glucosidase